MYSRQSPTPPSIPTYAEIIYWASFVLAIVFKDRPYIHALFSCLPLFLFLKLLLNRLQKGELGSSVICLGILAESIAHLFHQMAHDDRFKTLYYFEHLICALFLMMGNLIYVFEFQEKKHRFENQTSKKTKHSLYITSLIIIASGIYLMMFESQREYSNIYISYIKIVYAIPLTIQLIFSMHRINTTSTKSFVFGFSAALVYLMADLTQENNPLLHKFLHRLSIYLQTRQALSHIKWFNKNKLKFL